MIKNLIWDFDGMLFNSYPHMIEAMRRALSEFGVCTTSEEIFAPIKLSVGTCIRHYFPDADERSDTLRREVERRYNFWEVPVENTPVAHPFPGVPELLRAVCADGRKNLIYSHRGKNLYQYLDENGIRDCFEGFVTEDMRFPHKPAPDAILYLMKTFDLRPEETLMLGDREIDALSGINAGVHSCLFDEFGILPPSAAEYRIRTHDELYELLGVPHLEL